MPLKLIFDSHLDLAWNALSWKRNLRIPLSETNQAEAHLDEKGRGRATITFPEMRKGRVAICLGTMMGRVPYGQDQLHGVSLDFPAHENAYAFARGQLGYYEVMEAVGEVRILRTKSELNDHLTNCESADSNDLPIGIIIAMEGCDPIINPEQTEHWYQLGLRCASLVHYGRSAYAVGTGDDGPLTALGRQLLDEFAKVGMILDLTHLSDTSFFEALDRFPGAVLASHQNCRSLVSHQRQFTDEQINKVIERQGILGVALDAWMLYEGWERGKTDRAVVSLEAVADHIDHVCQMAGNSNHSAIGSDLDGGYGTEQTPTGLDTIADLQKLDAILSKRGYADADIKAIFYKNWWRFFERNLPA